MRLVELKSLLGIHMYVHVYTVTKFGYENKCKFGFNKWMTHARDRKCWDMLVEEKVNLSKNAYLRNNTTHKAAVLQTCNTI